MADVVITIPEIVGGVFLLLFLASAYVTAEAYYYQWYLGRDLERDLGFRDGAAYLRVGRRMHAAVAVEEVVEGGVYDRAGIRRGDVLPDASHSDLFQLLHRHRGREVVLSIVDGGAGPPFCQRPRRLHRLLVPSRRT